MRILILNPNQIKKYNWGNQLFKNAFSRHHDVVYYGPGFPDYNKTITVPKLLLNLKKKKKQDFDLIITYESKWSRIFKGLGEVDDIPKAHIVSDYIKPRKGFKGFAIWPTVDKLLKEAKPDIIFARTIRDVGDLKRNLGFENVFYLPFSVEINKYKNMNLNRDIDAMATFTTRPDVYPLRRKIQTMLGGMPIKTFTKRVINSGYIKTLNRSKIFANSGGVNYVSLTMKFTEVLACGTLLITEEPNDMQVAGFKNGKHFVVFKGLNDLKKKINYYLKHEKERKRIALEGMKFVRSNHNNDIRVKQFIDKIHEKLLC